MDLTKFPRGARTSKLCSLDMLRSSLLLLVVLHCKWKCCKCERNQDWRDSSNDEPLQAEANKGSMSWQNIVQDNLNSHKAGKTYSKTIWILLKLTKHNPRSFEFSQGWQNIFQDYLNSHMAGELFCASYRVGGRSVLRTSRGNWCFRFSVQENIWSRGTFTNNRPKRFELPVVGGA